MQIFLKIKIVNKKTNIHMNQNADSDIKTQQVSQIICLSYLFNLI